MGHTGRAVKWVGVQSALGDPVLISELNKILVLHANVISLF